MNNNNGNKKSMSMNNKYVYYLLKRCSQHFSLERRNLNKFHREDNFLPKALDETSYALC